MKTLQVCFLKRGERGSEILHPPNVPAGVDWPKAVTVIDITGAALAAVLPGATPLEAARVGHAMAAHVVTFSGAVLDMPER